MPSSTTRLGHETHLRPINLFFHECSSAEVPPSTEKPFPYVSLKSAQQPDSANYPIDILMMSKLRGKIEVCQSTADK